MKNRTWTGIVRNRPDDRIEISWYPDDNEMLINRYTKDGWEDATKISTRECNPGVQQIWVATFDDLSEILVNWWLETDELTIAYRGFSYDGWQAPAHCIDTTPEQATA